MSKYIPSKDEIPSGICECGCGKETNICKYTDRAKRFFKGYPYPRRRGHSIANAKRGSEHFNYKGGFYYDKSGYKKVRDVGNPDADSDGFIFEHRLVVARHIGRRLSRDEIVHHINEDKTDNRIENLQILSRSEHLSLHKQKWTKESVIAALHRYFKRFKKSPTTQSHNDIRYVPEHHSVELLFGSWANALVEAGLPPSGKKSP